MSFSELTRTAGQYSSAYHTNADFSSSSSDTADPDSHLLENIVKHVLELPSEQYSNTVSRVVSNPAPSQNNRNPYLGWARCPTFSIPPTVAHKMATNWTGSETYEGFFSKLETSKRANTLNSSAAAAGGSYYRRNYDSPPRKTPRSSPLRAMNAPVASTSRDVLYSSNHWNDIPTGRNSTENGTVDPRLVCPPPSSSSYTRDVPYSLPVPKAVIQRPPPGFEVSSAEKELIKMFPNYSQSIKVLPAVIFCNRCKQEIPSDPQAITEHATIHLINPKENPNKFGCLVGNCWRRLPLDQLGAHVAGHFKAANASCGMCGMVFPSPQLAREHLVAPCNQLQNIQRAQNFLATRPASEKKTRRK